MTSTQLSERWAGSHVWSTACSRSRARTRRRRLPPTSTSNRSCTSVSTPGTRLPRSSLLCCGHPSSRGCARVRRPASWSRSSTTCSRTRSTSRSPGRRITISTARVGSWVEIHVIDDGPGMSDEARAHAFDRFWRAGSAKGGSGLGLAIVERLVVSDGGSVELRPAPSGGIDAVVRLKPALQDPAPARNPASVARSV